MPADPTLFVPATPARRVLRKATEILLGRLPTGHVLGALPFVKRRYARLVMARRDHTGLYSGIYPSYEAALADIPPSRLAGWDHDDPSTLWVDNIDPIRPSTYPVLFWLNRLYAAGSALVDVGGSIGLTYYGYRRYADFPAGSTWTVLELPKICAQGSKTALRENAVNLRFVSQVSELCACDIMLSAGALQYMPRAIPGLLESLPWKPQHVLLNKLPITTGDDCWTLQNYGPAVSPHRLFNERQFVKYFTQQGYRLRDRWEVQDLDCVIPFHPERFIRQFSGFLFERV